MTIAVPTTSEVRSIYPAKDKDDVDVQSVINDAQMMADCTSIAAFNATRQKAIVKWIAAHLLATSNGATGHTTANALGDAHQYLSSGVLGSNLSGSRFGQQALALDTSGYLAGLGGRQATFKVL